MKRAAQIVIVALPVLMALLIARFAVDIPWQDEWEWADLIYKMHVGTLQFADVWAQHNEHRIFFPALLMLCLDRIIGWHQVMEQFISLGMLLLSQALIVTMILRTSVDESRGFVAAALASVFLYGLWQQENLAWGFQMAWFLCNLCAIGVVFLLARPNRNSIDVVLALLVAAVGSLSSSQGLLAWGAGAVAIALTADARKQTLVVWIVAAAAIYGIYRAGMESTETGHVAVFAEPLTAARYALTYLGAPLVRWLGNPSCVIAGTLLLGFLIAAFGRDVRSSNRLELLSQRAAWYAIATYALLCALATATGRAGFGIDQALNSRYTTISSLAWIALIGLAVTRDPAQIVTGKRRATAICAAIVAAYAIVANNAHGFVEWKKSSATLAIDRNELVRGDAAVLDAIYPYHARIVMLSGELRTIRDGPFTKP